MPSPKQSHRDARGRSFTEKSMSFHGKGSAMAGVPGQLRRPKTLPELPTASMIGGGSHQVSPSAEGRPKLTKLLLKVTIQGSLGPVQVLINPDSTVSDLITATVRQYVKEGRRPVLPISDPAGFDLHYSQFSLESQFELAKVLTDDEFHLIIGLNREENLAELGSRNFFLCQRSAMETASSSSCSKQAEKAARTGFGLPWLKFMGFMQ